MQCSHAILAIDWIPSRFAIIESRNKNSDSILSDSERSRTMRVNCKQLYTESLGCNIASDSASVKSSQSQIHANHVVNLPHYTKFLVNYPFVPLTAHSDIRITTRIGIYPKKPCQLYFRTIDLSFGIANLPFRIDSGKFGYTTGILGSTPSSGNKEYPLQWKLRVDPHSGNMVLIR